MQLIWAASDGTTITLSKDSTDYRLLKPYSGFSEAPVTHQTVKSPYQDGESLIDSRLDPREISIPIMIIADTLTSLQAKVRALSKALNPLLGSGTLLFDYENGTRYRLTCIGDGTPQMDPSNRSATHQACIINLIAHQPFWESDTLNREDFMAAATDFFPFSFPFLLGAENPSGTVTNSGDVSTPVTISIVGEVQDPCLTRSITGETDVSMNISITMTATERFVIVTGPGNPSATYYKSDGTIETGAFSYFDPDSVFWYLEPGDNTVTLTNVSIAAATYVSVEWRDRYVGV